MQKTDEQLMRRRTLSYLGDHKMEGALVLSEEIERCFAELQAEARFMACYEKYALDFDEEGYPVIRECSDLTFQSEDLRSIFAGCKSVCVLASTLGIEFERYSKRVMSMDMSHGVVLDAAASAYLEGMTDAYEADLALGAHTIRFAPGYGDLDLSYNAVLLRAINADKRIGISHTGGGLFLPQKSMLGLIGIGGEDGFTADRCKNCRKRDDCGFRKAGRTCYQRDEDTK